MCHLWGNLSLGSWRLPQERGPLQSEQGLWAGWGSRPCLTHFLRLARGLRGLGPAGHVVGVL